MSQVFYTSDLHFGHRKVAEIRGFDVVDEHDEALIDNWNLVVKPEDTVWVLGDVSLRAGEVEQMEDLNGTKHLVTGNHDACFPGNRDSYRKQDAYLAYFASIQAFIRRRIGGRDVMLSHFPYHADRGEERFGQYRLRDEGLPLLHGHTHSSERFTSLRELHVGLDAWGLKPVHENRVIAGLNSFGGKAGAE